MTTVAGVFRSRERAEHAAVDLRQTGLRSINLLIPGATASQVDAVPTTETEQPGMGKAIGGVLGGALGMAAGMELGAAAATLLIPGVGPVPVQPFARSQVSMNAGMHTRSSPPGAT